MAGMNAEGFDTEEWAGFSSDVQATYDMFGPVDFVKLMEADEIAMKDPTTDGRRWRTPTPAPSWAATRPP